MIAPLGWALLDDVGSQETKAFLVTIALGIILSSLVLWNVKVSKKEKDLLNAKDGLAIVGLSWILLSVFGALPLCMSGVVMQLYRSVL